MIPYWNPIVPRGSWFEQTWISTIPWSFHINFNFSGSVVLPEKIFKEFPYIIMCKTLIPYWNPIVLPGVMIWTNVNLHYISGSFHINFSFSGPVILEKNIFPKYSHVKLWSPNVAPSYPRGSWFKQTRTSTMRKLSQKYSAFLVQWFLRRRFLNDTTLYLHFRAQMS